MIWRNLYPRIFFITSIPIDHSTDDVLKKNHVKYTTHFLSLLISIYFYPTYIFVIQILYKRDKSKEIKLQSISKCVFFRCIFSYAKVHFLFSKGRFWREKIFRNFFCYTLNFFLGPFPSSSNDFVFTCSTFLLFLGNLIDIIKRVSFRYYFLSPYYDF